jgi:phosphoglycolate phosphatase-like HAD superfamily hydrolase
MQAVIFDLDHTLFTADNVLHEGAAELLAILHRLGVQIAGLSSKDHRALVRLDEAGIRPYFATVLCADQPIEPKEPAGVHHVLSLLGVEHRHAVLVSHAHGDILLGKDSGLARTIGVSHGSGKAGPLHEAGADHIVEDIPTILDVLE